MKPVRIPRYGSHHLSGCSALVPVILCLIHQPVTVTTLFNLTDIPQTMWLLIFSILGSWIAEYISWVVFAGHRLYIFCCKIALFSLISCPSPGVLWQITLPPTPCWRHHSRHKAWTDQCDWTKEHWHSASSLSHHSIFHQLVYIIIIPIYIVICLKLLHRFVLVCFYSPSVSWDSIRWLYSCNKSSYIRSDYSQCHVDLF